MSDTEDNGSVNVISEYFEQVGFEKCIRSIHTL